MQLTAAQIQVITALAGAQGEVPGLPDPYRGWFATEKEQSVMQASIMMVREGLTMYQDGKLLLRNDIHEVWGRIVGYQHVCAVSVQSNVDVDAHYCMYRDAHPAQAVWMAQTGFNAYTVQVESTNHVYRELCRVVPVRGDASGETFRMSTRNVERMLATEGTLQNIVSAYDIVNQYRGDAVESHRIMQMRGAWWYVEKVGGESYFSPFAVPQLHELFARCLRMTVAV
jgi:hypothetical protein